MCKFVTDKLKYNNQNALDVAIAFLFKADYTYGGYDTDRKVLGARLLEAGMVVDGVFDKSVSKGADSFYLASEPRV